MNPLDEEYLAIGERLAAALGRPSVQGLYLPTPVADETPRDEFGFVFLADGSVGPFYVSLGDLLVDLWRRHPEPGRVRVEAGALLQGLATEDLASRALALGAYNALSAALFRAAGFVPPARAAGPAPEDPEPPTRVGMVGYFCPLVDRLTAQGCEVRVLELAPQRVPQRERVSLCRDPHDLRSCDRVICTASTLVNGSLAGLLEAVGPHPRFELVGPSASGLPDPLFARGVGAVGGSLFGSREDLLGHLRRGESWGDAARKFQLDAAGYPGLDVLLAARRA